MEKSSVWSRVGAWFRGDGPDDAFAARSTQSPSPRPTASEPLREPGSARVVRAPTPSGSAATPRTNGAAERNDSKSHAAGARDDRIAELVTSIQEHLEAQVQGADVLVGSLDRLADGLERLPGMAKSELGVLERIGGDVTGAVQTLKRLEGALSAVPKLANTQGEAVVALTHELACLRETDAKIAGVLEGVGQVMVELRDGVGRSAGAMHEFRTDMAERHDRLARLVERQARRFVWLALAAVALGTVAAILGIVTLLR